MRTVLFVGLFLIAGNAVQAQDPSRGDAKEKLLQQKLLQLEKLQNEIDHLRRATGQPAHVLVTVHMVEIDLNRLRRAGIDHPLQKHTSGVDKGDSKLGLPMPASRNANVESTTKMQSFSKSDSEELLESLRSLQAKGIVKFLAEPSLMSASGRLANFLSGGEFPICSANADGKEVKYKSFGTQLQILPHVLAGERVHLECQFELSAKDVSNRVAVEGTVIPGLTTRRISSHIEMNLGQSFAIGGLVVEQNRSDHTVAQSNNHAALFLLRLLAELIGDPNAIPVIQAAKAPGADERELIELLVLITCEAVEPLDPEPPVGEINNNQDPSKS